jgi:hypothetical protein
MGSGEKARIGLNTETLAALGEPENKNGPDGPLLVLEWLGVSLDAACAWGWPSTSRTGGPCDARSSTFRTSCVLMTVPSLGSPPRQLRVSRPARIGAGWGVGIVRQSAPNARQHYKRNPAQNPGRDSLQARTTACAGALADRPDSSHCSPDGSPLGRPDLFVLPTGAGLPAGPHDRTTGRRIRTTTAPPRSRPR